MRVSPRSGPVRTREESIDQPADQLRAVLTGAVADGVVPGAAFAAGVGSRTRVRITCGTTGRSGTAVGPDTLFDLASVTKVMATTPAVLALHDAGRLDLAHPLGRYVPAFAAGDRAAITIRHLLAHTAGLLASRRYYRTCGSRAEVLAAVADEPLISPPGRAVEYSDLGFLLLGQVVEEITGAGLDAAVDELVVRPLGLARTGYRPAAGPFADTTEPGSEPGSEPRPGRPHDRNAQACGDVAGHAGLFATLDDVAAYAAWWAGDADGPVSPATRAEAVRCATDGLGDRRGLGWLIHGSGRAGHDFLTPAWARTTVLHTGFTGTSIAVDPATRRWAVLLTNAVHLGRGRPEVQALRERVHDLAATVLAPDG